MSLLRVISSIYPVSLPLSLLNPSGGGGGRPRGKARAQDGVARPGGGAAWELVGGMSSTCWALGGRQLMLNGGQRQSCAGRQV